MEGYSGYHFADYNRIVAPFSSYILLAYSILNIFIVQPNGCFVVCVGGALTEHIQACTHTHTPIHTRSLLVHIAFFTAQTCTLNAYHSDVIVDAAAAAA